jgi:hypothetical protein
LLGECRLGAFRGASPPEENYTIIPRFQLIRYPEFSEATLLVVAFVAAAFMLSSSACAAWLTRNHDLVARGHSLGAKLVAFGWYQSPCNGPNISIKSNLCSFPQILPELPPFCLPGRRLGLLAKKELLNVPILGYGMGFVNVMAIDQTAGRLVGRWKPPRKFAQADPLCCRRHESKAG